MFAPVLAGRTTAEWDDALAAAGVPAAPVRERDDLFDDEQAWADGPARARRRTTRSGDMVMTAPVVRLSESPGGHPLPGPPPGSRHARGAAELGLADGDIDALVADGVAFCAP